MTNPQQAIPVARTAMLIRKPAAEVFAAIINPKITTQFWFTKSSGNLEVGKEVEWCWEMYDVKVPVFVKVIELNKKIVIQWGNADHMTTVEWTFEQITADSTYVSIVNSGFKSSPELIAQISDSTKGFSFVLAGVKAWLEHGIKLNLVADAFPNKVK